MTLTCGCQSAATTAASGSVPEAAAYRGASTSGARARHDPVWPDISMPAAAALSLHL
jgi:hypothetical protein